MESMHQYVLEQLERARPDWETVSKGSGVPVSTIKKIVSRDIEYPRVDKVEKLATYFRTQKRRPS
jgi:hypothetical protein